MDWFVPSLQGTPTLKVGLKRRQKEPFVSWGLPCDSLLVRLTEQVGAELAGR